MKKALWRALIVALLLTLLVSGISFSKTGSGTTTPTPTPTPMLMPSPSQLSQAANYLEQLYNPSIGLCRETSTSESQNETIVACDSQRYNSTTDKIYWIASDNYLESLALKPYNPALSDSIKQKCDSYLQNSTLQCSLNLQGLPYYPYQIMEGNEIPLTLHVLNNYTLEQTSDHIVALNMSNGEINNSTYLDYPTHGDILVYEAINYYIQGYPLDWCRGLYMDAYNMFDGKGIADAHHTAPLNNSQYDNMKLALLLFGAKVLNLNVNLTQIESQLWLAQKPSGGITSCMDSTGKPTGTANGETTAFTLLAYDDNLIGQIQLERTPPINSINVTFPTACFNQTASITNNIMSIPLLNNWQVTSNNTVQWASTTNNPRVALGFFSSLADPGNASIQLFEYNNGDLDVVKHDADYPNGTTLQTLQWSNPLTVSLISGNLTVSSPAGTYSVILPGFSLAYITGGSTELDSCSGGEVNIQVEVITTVIGITREVNGNILSGVTITLDGIGPAVSDQNGQFQIMATATGNYILTAHEDGFRDRTQTISIAGLGEAYAVTRNFQGNQGLIPNAPNMQYALLCINRWLYPPTDPPGTGLSMQTALAVINAWLYPVQ